MKRQLRLPFLLLPTLCGVAATGAIRMRYPQRIPLRNLMKRRYECFFVNNCHADRRLQSARTIDVSAQYDLSLRRREDRAPPASLVVRIGRRIGICVVAAKARAISATRSSQRNLRLRSRVASVECADTYRKHHWCDAHTAPNPKIMSVTF